MPEVVDRWKATLIAGLIAICPVAALEILCSARNEEDFAVLDRALAALPQAPVTAAVCAAALSASRELHRDSHYDTLARVLGFVSVRLDDI